MQIKEISLGHDARLKIKAGIDKATAAVAPTLGAVGMSAMIDWEGLDPIISDDGVTILKNLEFKDKYENMGLKILRKGATRTSSEGGDGTATTTVLTRALIEEAMKEIVDSSNIQEVRERLEIGLQETIERLAQLKREVTETDIENIARISSLDPEVATLISEIIKEIGVNGVVTVEKSSTMGYSKEVVKGMRFDRGLISPYFLTDLEKEECVLENPAVVLVDRKISLNEHITGIMNSIASKGVLDVLFIADDVDSLALASMIVNHQQKRFKIGAVKNPFVGAKAKDFLFDVAALTGGTVISEEAGMKLEDANFSHIGRCEKVVINKDFCTIIGGKPSPALDERIKGIEKKVAETTSEYEKEMLEERLASLTGGIGVIRVGAYTDTDFNAKKYKFENGINATQAALQEGVVAGGGTALARISLVHSDPIFRTALIAPLKQQARNAGMHERMVVDYFNLPTDIDTGFNFMTKKQCNMFEEGIIDPYKVTRLALESAVAIAKQLITCETLIVREVEEEKK